MVENIKFEQAQRYRFIETLVLWEGKVNTNNLMNRFGIGRQQASKEINTYIRNYAPSNLKYDRSLKAYVPNELFSAVFSDGDIEEYFSLIDCKEQSIFTWSSHNSFARVIHQISLPKPIVQPAIIRSILQACRLQHRLEVDYRSINLPNRDGRIIAPHSVVFTGARWYVRAFCEKNGDFRDFSLTRFHSTPESLGKCTVHEEKEYDEDWNKQVEVCFVPDSRLSDQQQEVVARDYGMINGRLTIPVKAALVTYLIQIMRVDIHAISADPKAQQIVVENMDEIKRWVFS